MSYSFFEIASYDSSEPMIVTSLTFIESAAVLYSCISVSIPVYEVVMDAASDSVITTSATFVVY